VKGKIGGEIAAEPGDEAYVRFVNVERQHEKEEGEKEKAREEKEKTAKAQEQKRE
jgi:hypothetical protein